MEFTELVQERLANYEQERRRMAIASEVHRLGLDAGNSAFAMFDGLLLRVSKGATERQARREYSRSNHQELVS